MRQHRFCVRAAKPTSVICSSRHACLECNDDRKEHRTSEQVRTCALQRESGQRAGQGLVREQQLGAAARGAQRARCVKRGSGEGGVWRGARPRAAALPAGRRQDHAELVQQPRAQLSAAAAAPGFPVDVHARVHVALRAGRQELGSHLPQRVAGCAIVRALDHANAWPCHALQHAYAIKHVRPLQAHGFAALHDRRHQGQHMSWMPCRCKHPV